MKYTLSEIATIIGGTLLGSDILTTRVISDSRSVIGDSDSLFVAITGPNHDGHAYVRNMYERGVRGFLVSEKFQMEYFTDAGFIYVENTLEALQKLAAHHRNHFRGTVVAITGSNGKTVVKEWIAQLCPANVKMFRSPRSYNSQLGVALSVLMIEGDEQIAVIEAGMSRCGEMERLERIIKPEIGIITNIGDAHQENFATTQEKLREKLILFKDSKTIIYNSSMELIANILREIYPAKELIEVNATDDIPFSDNASRENASQAVAMFTKLGFDRVDIIKNISHLQPIAMRLELREGVGGSKIINDTYNSDINSLAVALDYIDSVCAGQKKVLILSDIFQTGMPERELYSQVAQLIAKSSIEYLIGVGDGIKSNGDLFSCRRTFYNDTNALIAALDKSLFYDKTVLIKGSRAFALERVGHLLEQRIHSTVLEVNLDAMTHNLNQARAKLTHGVKVMAMVKALSYGSGSFEVAALLQHQRIDYLAVAFADEGVALREAGITMPIVVLNADSWSFSMMIDYRLEPEIYSISSLVMFVEEVKRHSENGYPIHIKLDTGMHRLGFCQTETEQLIKIVRENSYVYISSVFSHLATSDEPAQDKFTLSQIDAFERISSEILSAFPDRKIIRHIANSAAIERFPQAQYNMVRLGISLYGVSSYQQKSMQCVSTLKSRIVQIKHLKKGDTIGYGRKGVATDGMLIATIPMGYADGLDRRLGCGRFSFNVNGRLAPTIGNICMDTCMIDITGIDVVEGDEVVIFGEQPSVIDMAKVLDTISYEIFTSISSRVKRVYIKE